MEPKTQTGNFAAPAPEELLKHLPAKIRERFAHFLATGDPAAADAVVLAIVRDHVPARKQGSTPPLFIDSMSLMGDLGIDSVSIADAVFTLEEVFNVSISTKEIMRLSTIGDLRAFIRRKLSESRN
jgi:acyl carrier protein